MREILCMDILQPSGTKRDVFGLRRNSGDAHAFAA
jgi:hypothetical protein